MTHSEGADDVDTEGTLSSVWDTRVGAEFAAKDADQGVATMTADAYVDYTPQPAMAAASRGVRGLCAAIRQAFPDFHAVIHWQTAEGEIVTTFKTYYGTHRDMAPAGAKGPLQIGASRWPRKLM
jgi:hypothetical protein